ncbi:MAG: SDR family oxidoreductase [Planctomycetaceae bacterium]|jgi:NADP-dependent 3-hydroxy acid dehydrogenase YdfG
MGGTQRVALVTGGGSGIGAAVAQRLAADGYRVVVAGRRAAELARTASAALQQISTAVVDVANRGAVEGWIASVLSELGRIDVLVNCAGMNTVRRTVADLSAADWQRVMEVNASGAFHCIQCVLPAMRSRGSGTIINISSVAGIRAVPLGGVAYNASKFAMTALGTTVGEEERPNGIRVSNIFPGEVDTPILEARPTPVTPEHRARMLQPDDVAATVGLICQLPPRVRIPELVIIPLSQSFA